MARGHEYTIAELAAATGMTARNIRSYRTRGLLRAPRLRGRVGYYGSEHLTQLRLVQALLGRGLGLAVIAQLVERGVAQTELARLVRDELTPPARSFAVLMAPEIVATLERDQPGLVAAMAELGLGRRVALGYLGDPGLFAMANALVAAGVPTASVGQVCLVSAQAAAFVVHLTDDDRALAETVTDPDRTAALVLVELATTAFRTSLSTRLLTGGLSAPVR